MNRDTPSSLPIAEIEDPAVTVVSTGNPLPAPVIIGQGGVFPPARNVFAGDSETLSGLLVSPALNRLVAGASLVHINADFAGQTSDRDPLLASISGPR